MYEIFIILLLVVFNGMLSMSEIALISARRTSLARDEKQGSRSARVALRLAENPDRFLSTVQIGITAIGILTGLYSGDVLAGYFSSFLVEWGIESTYAHGVAQAIIIVLVTYVTLVIGELIPKKIGMTSPERAAKLVARPMMLLSRLASPLVWILMHSTAFISRCVGIRASREKVTEEEICSMIGQGTIDGEVQEVEQDIVQRVFMLGDLRISSLMTHRTEIVSIDISMNGAQIRQLVRGSIFEMYPVVDGSLDLLRGVVYLKDMVPLFDGDDFSLLTTMRQAVYFHQAMSVYKALHKMRELRVSQMVVCDEFGGVQGIITLKDILGALVGGLGESNDQADIIERPQGGWFVDGQCSFVDFLTYFDCEQLHSANSDINTIGGLLLEQLEHIPTTGERVLWSGFDFEIVDMDGARIDKILVTQLK